MEGDPRESERFVAGDPLRALAALGVFVFHVAVFAEFARKGTSGAFGHSVQRALAGMNIGVWMFFVLSGYLLARPFVSGLARPRAELPAVGPFLRNRIRRLVPGLWVLIAVSAIVRPEAGRPSDFILAGLFAQVYKPTDFNQQFAHAWTLDAEMFFYVSLPVVFGLIIAVTRTRRRRARMAAVVALLAGAAVVSIVLRMGVGNSVFHAQVPWTVFFAFVPGVLLALGEDATRARITRRAAPLSRTLLIAVVVVALVALAAGALLPAKPIALRSIAAVFAAGLIVAAALVWQWTGHRTTRVLDNAPLRWLGRRSYSFYLFHLLIVEQIAFALAPHYSGKSLLVLTGALSFAAAVLAAAVGYRLIERPFMRRKEPWRPAVATERGHYDGALLPQAQGQTLSRAST